MTKFHEIPTTKLAATFETNYVDRRVDDWHVTVVKKLNESGLAIFDGIESDEEFLSISGLFGQVRTHAQTDTRGITTMVASNRFHIEDGRVETPLHEQLFHTDGTKMIDPPGAVMLYCETPDPAKPRVNVFANGKALYERIADEDPTLLTRLREPIDFGDFSSPVFPVDDQGLTSVRYRQAPEPPRMALSGDDRAAVDAHLRSPDILSGVTLERGQGVIFNNYIALHGLAATVKTGRIAKRIQLSTPIGSRIMRGFKV